jgi:hypothetical protein
MDTNKEQIKFVNVSQLMIFTFVLVGGYVFYSFVISDSLNDSVALKGDSINFEKNQKEDKTNITEVIGDITSKKNKSVSTKIEPKTSFNASSDDTMDYINGAEITRLMEHVNYIDNIPSEEIISVMEDPQSYGNMPAEEIISVMEDPQSYGNMPAEDIVSVMEDPQSYGNIPAADIVSAMEDPQSYGNMPSEEVVSSMDRVNPQ